MGEWATLDGTRIISGSVVIPYYGAWAADVVLSNANAIPPQSTLVLGDLVLTGTAFRAFSYAGSRGVRLIGGANGWPKTLSPKAYQSRAGVPVGMILGDAAIEVGETIVVPSALNISVGTSWMRAKAPAQRLLRQLAGPLWWIDPNGVTQLAARRADPIASAFQVLTYSGGKGHFTVSTEVLADWMPGRTFTSPIVTTAQTVSLVTHTIDNDGKHRVEVLSTP